MPQAKILKKKYRRYLLDWKLLILSIELTLLIYRFLFCKPILIRQLKFVLHIVYLTFVPFLSLTHFIYRNENHTSALQRSKPVSCYFHYLMLSYFLCSLNVVLYLFQANFKVVVCIAQIKFNIKMSCMGQLLVDILFTNGERTSDGTKVHIVLFASN